jgi:sulfur transfer protein SufE
MLISDYKDTFDSLSVVSASDVYRYLISLGKKLQDDPLSEEKRVPENQVTYCQYQLYVDYEDGRFKAWSDALTASGYAYILVDVFNSRDDGGVIDPKEFEELGVGQWFSIPRQGGFFQMLDMMNNRL